MKRTFAAAVVAAAIVLGAIVGWSFAGTSHKKASPPVSAVNRSTHSPSASSTPVVSRPLRIIRYHDPAHPGMGITVAKPEDVRLLHGTSAAFKDFVATTVRRMIAKGDCRAAYLALTIGAYATSGFATGEVNDCGGYVALWGVQNGAWKLLIGTQAVWQCSDLERYGVPPALIAAGGSPLCWDQATRKDVTYRG